MVFEYGVPVRQAQSVCVTSIKVVRPSGTWNEPLTISLTQSCYMVFLSGQQWASSGPQCCPRSWSVQVKGTSTTLNINSRYWKLNWEPHLKRLVLPCLSINVAKVTTFDAEVDWITKQHEVTSCCDTWQKTELKCKGSDPLEHIDPGSFIRHARETNPMNAGLLVTAERILALDSDLLAQTIVANHLDHFRFQSPDD